MRCVYMYSRRELSAPRLGWGSKKEEEERRNEVKEEVLNIYRSSTQTSLSISMAFPERGSIANANADANADANASPNPAE